jgi:hypothetical protein
LTVQGDFISMKKVCLHAALLLCFLAIAAYAQGVLTAPGTGEQSSEATKTVPQMLALQ